MSNSGMSRMLSVFSRAFLIPVSYTHLDVYKRQIISSSVPSESIISGGYKPSLGYELAMEEKLKENIKTLASGGLIV